MNVFKTRYSLLFTFIILFISLSFIVRCAFIWLSWGNSAFSLFNLATIFIKGFLYDLAVAVFFSVPYAIYLLLLPEKWNRSATNRTLTYTGYFILILLCMFSFFAEITFWKEFESRFNFIAVDYLIYTYEVVNNIRQSYPLEYLAGGMILITSCIMLFFEKRKVFRNSFHSTTPLLLRFKLTGMIIIAAITAGLFLNTRWAEKSTNSYVNELSKAGIFSFFNAFKSNELDYERFYLTTGPGTFFPEIQERLKEPGSVFNNNNLSIRRQVNDTAVADRPNVIMITIESLSADFLEHFGNKEGLTPTLDSIAGKSVLFTDMYATGTRTVRGMEALTLSIPPTPGNSIVRRANNDGLFCIGTVFKKAGYSRTFFYGGDGYFDNMNSYFGNNGFNITDRGSHLVPGEHFTGKRTRIPDEKVHFENAWGICDEDLYDAVIRDADEQYASKQPFYDFVMTTSNHRPYTYPSGKIDIAPGTGRNGAVKYTDYAIKEFLKKIQEKPWFKNTVIIFIADHCASSGGKNEINISRYHIPCMIYNLKDVAPFTIDKQCSQIDLYPTLFGMLGWSYESDFYGKNVLLSTYQPRAFVGTYQKLGYLVNDSLQVLGPGRQADTYLWNKTTNEQTLIDHDTSLRRTAIAYYQSAYYLFKNGLLKEAQ